MGKTIIVSNRLPVKVQIKEGDIDLQISEGGLATGLGSIYREGRNVWIGWPGTEIETTYQEEVTAKLASQNLRPVFLNELEISNYYEGFSNEVLWPICHYMATYAQFEQAYWEYYQTVNQKFCDSILAIAEADDIIWIHDYQLLLLPQLVRQALPNISIAFFHHIPFPSFEIFRLIPWRNELITGLLGADLIGFHTYDDVNHFINSASHLLNLSGNSNKLLVKDREVTIDAFPMGIDFEKFASLTHDEEVEQEYHNYSDMFEEVKVILSIDRLDYSKGILQRLQAFEMLLTKHEEYLEKVVLVMIVVPSRDSIPQYKELKDEIDKVVGNINAQYRTPHWHPIQYFYRSFPINSLSALYSRADICLVTPMRDGMNLVSKEYIASRKTEDGVLILSEMAGSSKELTDALIINPNSYNDLYNAILRALKMPLEEQRQRMHALTNIVRKFDIHHWVKIFMKQLRQIKEAQLLNKTLKINEQLLSVFKDNYDKASSRLFFLDYDGTLVDFHQDIEKAVPDDELYGILHKLIHNQTQIVIISGRKHSTLEQWFGHLPIDLIAEHGAWKKIGDVPWQRTIGLSEHWKTSIRPMLESYSDRTPGALIEEKDFSLAWHYRKVDRELGKLRAAELINNLTYLTRESGLQILPGNKVVEIKSAEVNKGKAALDYIHSYPSDFIIAIGDDHTDEDIFNNLPTTSFTIKVGNYQATAARYYLKSVTEVRKFLKILA